MNKYQRFKWKGKRVTKDNSDRIHLRTPCSGQATLFFRSVKKNGITDVSHINNIYIYIHKYIYIYIYILIYKYGIYMYGIYMMVQIDKQVDRQVGRQIDRQIDRWID